MFSTSASPFEPNLPAHCEPTNDFFLRFSAIFHTCIPSPLAFVSNTLGILSIVSWLFSQLPQIYTNWRLQSTAGLSFNFLLIWFLGDLSNLLGATFTHQASWQVVMSSYYVFVDTCLISQWVWYEILGKGKKIQSEDLHGIVIKGISPAGSRRSSRSEGGERRPGKSNEMRKGDTKSRAIIHPPRYGQLSPGEQQGSYYSALSTPGSTEIHVAGTPPPPYSPSSRTLLLVASLAANIAQATPINKPVTPPAKGIDIPGTSLGKAGTILSWMSTLLYLGSRLPQLIKNWRRKSTSGLSPQLFAAAFCGNLFYSSALLSNPCAWNDFGPYGGGGWAGAQGSDRMKWVRDALPFFLGAAGVLVLDAGVGVQFVLYGGNDNEVMVAEEREGRSWRWQRVSGWIRGWIPRLSGDRSDERRALLRAVRQETRDYGAL